MACGAYRYRTPAISALSLTTQPVFPTMKTAQNEVSMSHVVSPQTLILAATAQADSPAMQRDVNAALIN